MTELEDAYARALRDPPFAARFAAAYRGEHDPMDVLWWQAHPLETSPSGLPPASLLRRELQRAVYSGGTAASGDPSGSGAAADRLHELQLSIAAERAAVDHALEVAEADEPEAKAPEGPGDDNIEDSPTMHRRRLPGPALLALLVAGAVAIGIAGLLLRPALDAALAPTAKPAGVALLDRAQDPSDLPGETAITELAYADISIDSLRRLDLNPSIAAPTPTNRAYLARDLTDRVCLVVLDDVVAFAMACVTEEQFGTSGVRVAWSTVERLRLGDDPVQATRGVTVAPNGAVVSTLAPRFPPSTGYRSSING